MGKKKGKRVDPEKKAALQAKKEAKAEKVARKRLEKESKSVLDGVDVNDTSDEHQFDALLQQYKANDRKAIDSAQVEILDGFPLARANATLTLNEDGKKKNAELYLFGGEYYDGVENVVLDHLLTYNVAKNEWKRIHTPTTPPARCAHSCVYYNHSLYVFGGEMASTDQYHHYKDLWRFDINTKNWEEIKPSKAVGTHPTARSGHTALVWKHYMILFGGFYEAAKDTPRWFNDVCVMNLQNQQWLEIPHSKLAARPEARSACNAAIVGDDLVVHGGFSKLSKGNSLSRSTPTPSIVSRDGNDSVVTSETKVHNDAWVLRLKPILSDRPPSWERLTSTVQRASLNSDQSPNGRSGTSSAAFKDRMLSFGGVVDAENLHHKLNSVFYADLFAFDPERRKWFPVVVKVASAGGKARRRRKQPTNEETKRSKTTGGDEDSELESDDDEDEADVNLEEVSEGENVSNQESGWDLEKLRSNMFAFIDGEGNLVYEKLDDSDDEKAGETNSDVDEEKEEETKDGESEEESDRKPNAETLTNPSHVVGSSSVMTVNPRTHKPEAVKRAQPLPRINSKLVVSGNMLYVYGGLVEVGDREVTLDDLWSLDLRKRDNWNCVWQGSMEKQVWRGAIHDDDDSYYSNTDRAAEEEDEVKEDDDDDNEVEQPNAPTENSKTTTEIRAEMNEIVRQFQMDDELRTPNPGEDLSAFYERTAAAWKDDNSKEGKREGFDKAKERFEELAPAVVQLKELENQYKKAKAAKKDRKNKN